MTDHIPVDLYTRRDNGWSNDESGEDDAAVNYSEEYSQDEIINRCDFRHDHVISAQILSLTSIIHQEQLTNIPQPQEDQVMNKDATDTNPHTLDTNKTFPTMLKLISNTLVGGANYSDIYENEMSSSTQPCNNRTNNNQLKVPTLPEIARKVAKLKKKTT